MFLKIIYVVVALVVAGYMFSPLIQSWVTANTTGSVNLTWLTQTVMPLLAGVIILIIALKYGSGK